MFGGGLIGPRRANHFVPRTPIRRTQNNVLRKSISRGTACRALCAMMSDAAHMQRQAGPRASRFVGPGLFHPFVESEIVRPRARHAVPLRDVICVPAYDAGRPPE